MEDSAGRIVLESEIVLFARSLGRWFCDSRRAGSLGAKRGAARSRERELREKTNKTPQSSTRARIRVERAIQSTVTKNREGKESRKKGNVVKRERER